MDVKCPGCYKITTVFSHAQGVVVCAGCSTILCQPTGGRAKLTEGMHNCDISKHLQCENVCLCNRFTNDILYLLCISLQDARSDGSHTKHGSLFLESTAIRRKFYCISISVKKNHWLFFHTKKITTKTSVKKLPKNAK